MNNSQIQLFHIKQVNIGIQVNRPAKLNITKTSNLWKQCKIWGKNIPIRSYSSSSIINHNMYVYGGQQMIAGVLQDFYSFNLQPKEGYQWTQQNRQNGPGKRARHASTSYQNKLYIHGGITGSFINSNSFYSFDVQDKKWTNLTNNQSPKLQSHCLLNIDGKIYALLGFDGNLQSYTNAIYSYDIKQNKWQTLFTHDQKNGISVRGGSTTAYDQNGNIWAFGGKDDFNRKNDLWKFNMQEKKWTQINYNKQIVPMQRNGHIMIHYNGKLVVFGGIHDITWQLNDLIYYSIKENIWKLLQLDSARRNDSQNGSQKKNTMVKSSIQSPKKKSTNYKTFLEVYQDREINSGGKMLDQQKKKKFLQKKAQLLKRFQIDQKSAKQYINIQPISQAMKDSLNLIGNPGNIKPHSPHKSPSKRTQLAKTVNSKFLQPLAMTYKQQIGKKPCARDGLNANIYKGKLIIFGGDRHQMSFNDVYILSLSQI